MREGEKTVRMRSISFSTYASVQEGEEEGKKGISEPTHPLIDGWPDFSASFKEGWKA